MGNNNETKIDLLLEQELNKLKVLIEKIQETNQNVVKKSTQFDEIRQKYEDISLKISDIESKLIEPINTEDFVNIEHFQSQKDDVDSQIKLIKKAQLSLNKQLNELNSLFAELTPSIENSFNEKFGNFISIDSFEKEIDNLQQLIKKISIDSKQKNDIEVLKNSIDDVNKEIAEIYRLAGDIDKEKISKLEVRTSENFRKLKEQFSNHSLAISQQSKNINSITKTLSTFVLSSRVDELENKIIDKESKQNIAVEELKGQNKKLIKQIKRQKIVNIIFVLILFFLTVITYLNLDSWTVYKTINKLF
jgi:hypothetical protein